MAAVSQIITRFSNLCYYLQRKIFLDGRDIFMQNEGPYIVWTPKLGLGEIYNYFFFLLFAIIF